MSKAKDHRSSKNKGKFAIQFMRTHRNKLAAWRRALAHTNSGPEKDRLGKLINQPAPQPKKAAFSK